MAVPKKTIGILLGCIIISKGISTGSPYLLKHAIHTEENKSKTDKGMWIFYTLGLYYLSRVSTSYLNELRNVLVAKAATYPTKQYIVGLLPTDPFTIRNTVPSIPIFIKQLERKKKAYKSLFTIKYTHIIPTGLELGLAGLLVTQQLGWIFSGTLFATVGFYIARSIQITNSRVDERKQLHLSENKMCHSVNEYITGLSISYLPSSEDAKEKKKVDSNITSVLHEEERLTTSLRQLNTEQQVILGTGGIIMSYLWHIQPELGISDFVMMNILMQQLFQPLNQVGMIYREWKQSKYDLSV